MAHERRTRIVATVGPASRDPEMLAALVEAGVNVFRLNLSHGTHEQHLEVIERIRGLGASIKRHIAILGDLCGPKIRVGLFPGGSVMLETGAEVVVTTRDVPGSPSVIPSQYASLHQDVRPAGGGLQRGAVVRLAVAPGAEHAHVDRLAIQVGRRELPQ